MESVEARPEPTQPTAPPPLAAWWGHTGLLYVGASALAAAVGMVVAPWILRHAEFSELFPFEIEIYDVQVACVYGAVIAAAQWLVLRRIVRRALCTVWDRDLSQTGHRLVRSTAFWVVMTITGIVIGKALVGPCSWLLLPYRLGPLLDGLILGLSLGTVQWLILRRQVPRVWRWIPWTAAGAVMGNLVQTYGDEFFTVQFTQFTYGHTLTFAVLWIALYYTVISALQAVCLRRLAPGWMKRLHDAARAAPSDSAKCG
jgi:hypothetical protein